MTSGSSFLTFGLGIAAIAGILIGGQALLGLAMASDSFAALPPAIIGLAANLLLFGAIAAIAAVMLARDGRLARVAGPNPGRGAGIGLALGVAGVGLAAAQAMVAGTLIDGSSTAEGSWLLIGLFAIAVQAGGEEIAFRGWLQPMLARVAGPAVALLLPTLAFTLLHLAGGARAPLALLNLFLGGLWFALLALRSGGIALPAAAHIAWNAAERLGLGLDPNPGLGAYGSLLDYDLAGDLLWGGSAEGLNASLGTTAVLLALILPVAAWRQPREAGVSATPA
jgi:uncharacterized protein